MCLQEGEYLCRGLLTDSRGQRLVQSTITTHTQTHSTQSALQTALGCSSGFLPCVAAHVLMAVESNWLKTSGALPGSVSLQGQQRSCSGALLRGVEMDVQICSQCCILLAGRPLAADQIFSVGQRLAPVLQASQVGHHLAYAGIDAFAGLNVLCMQVVQKLLHALAERV